MKNIISIRPSKDLRTNYNKISELSRENPVAITVNGKDDTVIMSHDYFVNEQKYIAELEEKLAVYSALALAKDDIKLNRIENFTSATNGLLEDFGSLLK